MTDAPSCSAPNGAAKKLPLPGDDHLAYHHHHPDGASLGIIFLPGLMSHMNGNKALALEQHCQRRSLAYTRFDYRGHGESSGAFIDFTFTQGLDDVLTVMETIAAAPQRLILVGEQEP